jgi:GH25 family lysozyme M1 (1,4-beta-N-acetylmuramidase)
MQNRAVPKRAIQPPNAFLIQWTIIFIIAAFFVCAEERARAQRPLGVDVSSYQDTPNWTSVRNSGIVFAWAKATEGTFYEDADFVYNETNGKTAGIYMGAYHFAHPDSYTPDAEASYFWNFAGNYIRGDTKTLMPQLDFEVFSGVTGASSYADWANQWCSDVVSDAAAGGVSVRPIIYTSTSEGCNFDSSVAQWFPWIASPNGENPQTGTPWSSYGSCDVWGSGVWTLWQYSQGAVSGISGNVDLDVFDGDSISGLVVTNFNSLPDRVGIAATADGKGYWITASDGTVFTFGDAKYYGSMSGQHINVPVVGIAARPQGDGYWLVGGDGGIFTFGNAGFHGSLGGQTLSAPIVGIAATADGGGYWEVGSDGGIYPFGDAPTNGSLPGLNVSVHNVVGMTRAANNGYWLAGSDGGVFSFDATFYGSMGNQTLGTPVVGMVARPEGDGYWLTGSDGTIYAFGSATNFGGMNGQPLVLPITGVAATADGRGYWELGADGGIFKFGDALSYGNANEPQPAMGIQETNNSLLISWQASTNRFRLLQNSSLTNTWVANLNATNLVNGTNQVTVVGGNGTLFFRLINP